MEESQGPRPPDGPPELWTPTAEVAAEVKAAVAAAGEVVAEFTLEGDGGDVGEAGDEAADGESENAETRVMATAAAAAAVAADVETMVIPTQGSAAVAADVETMVIPTQGSATVEDEAAEAEPDAAAASAETVAIPVQSAPAPAESIVPEAVPEAVPEPEPAPAALAPAPAPSLPTFGAQPQAAAAAQGPAQAPTPASTPASAPASAPSPNPGPPADQISRHIARAEALAELGRRQQALDVLNELIVAGAEDVRVWRALATVYLETGEGEKALRAADWVVTFAPGDEWGYRLRANALRMLDRPEEAVTAASEAVRLGPDVWQSRASLAMALHGTGDLSAAAAEARKAADMAKKAAPESAPEASLQAQHQAKQAEQVETIVKDAEQIVSGLEGLEAALAGPAGADDAGLEHVGGLVLRGLEFSAVAGWAVSFGGIAIGNFKLRLLIPLVVLLVLAVFLFRPARKAGRDIWRYLVEYLWKDTKTRSALLMSVAAHVWMIAGSSVGHVQGGSALLLGLLTHLTGRTVLAKKAPELNPIRRSTPQPAPESGPEAQPAR